MRHKKSIICGALATMILLVIAWPKPLPHMSGPLAQDVYIWQRKWNGPVQVSIAEHGTNFSELVALHAEVNWSKGLPLLVRVPIDYEALRQSRSRIGLALRIGSFAGPFRSDDHTALWLAELAASLTSEAISNHVAVTELQIDFDCAESKLEGYALWVKAIRKRIAPVPVTITTLPSWLKRRAFTDLIAAADGYVLQVHSLERPRSMQDGLSLCDPEAARKAVRKAAGLGKPFRVALPTYSYLMAFDATGRFVGLSAEGPAKTWTKGVRLREVSAQPAAMAALVREWTHNRPAALQGLIWYRLPVPEDTLNWNWATLAMVMAGNNPEATLQAELRRPNPGLLEVDLANTGSAQHAAPVQLALQWNDGNMVACDALQDFEIGETGMRIVHFKSKPGLAPFQPGERRTIGWLRLSQETEVKCEMSQQQN